MRVIVITTCLNAAPTIAATVESVLAGGAALDRYIVVDGGSTDGTLDVVRGYEPRFEGRLVVHSEPDDGIYFAMNRGLELAEEHGAPDSFVLFLGADDRIVSGALDRVAEEYESLEAPADLVYGDVVTVETDGRTRTVCGSEPVGTIAGLPRAMPACHQASLFTLHAYRELGGFDTAFRIAADYEFYLRFHDAGLAELYVPVTVAEYSLGGLSSTRGVATADEYRRAWVLHGVNPAVARTRMMQSVTNLKIMGVVRSMGSRGDRGDA